MCPADSGVTKTAAFVPGNHHEGGPRPGSETGFLIRFPLASVYRVRALHVLEKTVQVGKTRPQPEHRDTTGVCHVLKSLENSATGADFRVHFKTINQKESGFKIGTFKKNRDGHHTAFHDSVQLMRHDTQSTTAQITIWRVYTIKFEC